MSARVGFQQLTDDFLPANARRGGRFRAWASALASPLVALNKVVHTTRTQALTDLARTSKHGPLQARLNDLYDPTRREIFLRTDSAGVGTVRVPIRLALTGRRLDEFNALVRSSLSMGRTFTIVYVP